MTGYSPGLEMPADKERLGKNFGEAIKWHHKAVGYSYAAAKMNFGDCY